MSKKDKNLKKDVKNNIKTKTIKKDNKNTKGKLKKDNIFNKMKNKIKSFYHKKIINNKNKFNMKEVILFMLITFSFGIIIGGVVLYGKGPFSTGLNSSMNEFIATYNEISSSYYQDVDDNELLEAGIRGLIGYLGDPYSAYMDGEEAANFNEDVEGTYQGIGAEITYQKDKVCINRVFEDSPAFKAGLLKDDILIKVNDKDITGMTLAEVSNVVKGEKNTEVKLTIIRDNEEKEITIKRDVVDNISVTSEIIEKDDKKVGYLYISVFAANTYKQFEKELKALEEKKIDSLIIDVRGNSGGYLTTVTDIISLFIKKGEAIYQLKTRDKVEIIYDKTKDERDYPIVMLVDGASASASEVLAGAMKEAYHATIVGTKTFGKGKVQKVTALTNGSLVKYTYQEWLTPLGNYIDKEGITPDESIQYVYDKDGKDNQKDKAVEVLLSK